MPFNLGPAELIIILAIALIVFGPKKLPDIGRGIGQAMREFNKARNDFMDSLHSEMDREPSRYTSSSDTSYGDSTSASTGSSSLDTYDPDRRLEYPEPLDEEEADAQPYGGAFRAADGDSQPVQRTAHSLDAELAGQGRHA